MGRVKLDKRKRDYERLTDAFQVIAEHPETTMKAFHNPDGDIAPRSFLASPGYDENNRFRGSDFVFTIGLENYHKLCFGDNTSVNSRFIQRGGAASIDLRFEFVEVILTGFTNRRTVYEDFKPEIWDCLAPLLVNHAQFGLAHKVKRVVNTDGEVCGRVSLSVVVSIAQVNYICTYPCTIYPRELFNNSSTAANMAGVFSSLFPWEFGRLGALLHSRLKGYLREELDDINREVADKIEQDRWEDVEDSYIVDSNYDADRARMVNPNFDTIIVSPDYSRYGAALAAFNLESSIAAGHLKRAIDGDVQKYLEHKAELDAKFMGKVSKRGRQLSLGDD